MMLFSTATNLRLGFRKGVISTDTPYKHVDEEDKTPSQIATPLADDIKNYRHQQVGTISDRSIENVARE